MAFRRAKRKNVLPAEITEEVCSYLEVNDLLNLSATNKHWRNAVNQDRIWRRHCADYFNVDRSEYPIIGRRCRVEPPFRFPTNDSLDLTDICPWRIRFAQEMYILNNWKERRFHVENLPVDLRRREHSERIVIRNFILFVFRSSHHSRGTTIYVRKLTDYVFEDRPYFEFSASMEIYPFRNGFLIIDNPLIYFYIINGDHFYRKSATLITTAFNPEVPLDEDLSRLKQSGEKFSFDLHGSNIRYFFLLKRVNKTFSFIFWDLIKFETFKYTFKLKNYVNDNILLTPQVFFGENESSILYIKTEPMPQWRHNDLTIVGILNIKNPNDIILNHYIADGPNYKATILGDSLGLVNKNKLVYLRSDRSSHILRIPEINRILNCRNYICALSGKTKGKSNGNKIVLIDKINFFVKEYLCENIEIGKYIRGTNLDLFVIISNETFDVKNVKKDFKKLNLILHNQNFESSNSNQIVFSSKAFFTTNYEQFVKINTHPRLKAYHFW